tara:strand:+ start:1155 stop:1829 length:675 start_codon:yes stop_codon:yes gene_type:complete
MKKFILGMILLPLVVGKISAEAIPGLEVGFTFGEIYVSPVNIINKAERPAIEPRELERAIARKIAGHKLRRSPMSLNGSFLQVELIVIENIFVLEVKLCKIPAIYGIDEDGVAGKTFISHIKPYRFSGIHAGDAKLIQNGLERTLGEFLEDYVDSNKKYHRMFKEKRLMGVDKRIYSSINMELRKGIQWNHHVPKQPIHAGWWLKYQELTGLNTDTHPSAAQSK